MEEQKENSLPHIGSSEQGGGSPKSKYWKFVGGFFVLILVGVIGIPMVGQYMQKQEDAKRAQDTENYMKFTLDLQERLKNDKDGGATPEETLKMFTDALKAGDIEQASKYFVFYPEEKQAALIGLLGKLENAGELGKFVEYLEKVKLEVGGDALDGDIMFSYLNKEGKIDIAVEITKSNYSTVWKIENLMF